MGQLLDLSAFIWVHLRPTAVLRIKYFFSLSAKCVIIMPMMEVSKIIQKQPYLNYDEQRALESIILRVITAYPVIRKMVLYGSKARGNFSEESDIDLLFVTDNALSRAVKFEISDAVYEAEVEHDVVVSAVFVTTQDFQTKNSPFLKRVRSEGIVLWARE